MACKMSTDRLERQLQFLIEVDKLKNILRRTKISDGSRLENDAEHTWHLMMMAVVLEEHANERVDLSRVIRMLMIHDIVEIDAGDTFAYDEAGKATKQAREEQAATRLFGMLPDDQAILLRELWQEFEARRTPESRYAAALDRLQPMLLNYLNKGDTWRNHGITSDRVHAFNAHIGAGSQTLWEYAQTLIKNAVAEGYLQQGEDISGE